MRAVFLCERSGTSREHWGSDFRDLHRVAGENIHNQCTPMYKQPVGRPSNNCKTIPLQATLNNSYKWLHNLKQPVLSKNTLTWLQKQITRKWFSTHPPICDCTGDPTSFLVLWNNLTSTHLLIANHLILFLSFEAIYKSPPTGSNHLVKSSSL